MNSRAITQFVREGDFLAEIEVHLNLHIGWAPYLSERDGYRLDDLRDALRAADLERASHVASRLYRLDPIKT